ncbi:LCP family protein required for cell wall assembly [Kineosphaera limosa]|uniref:Putative LytR family regulatory protein n=1 Tax=Kineosphaera limosa NBRC 100340 TaxID=1184609 RepID=K6WC92_9MICO|nr:LCP family protein [Kineosphaera limosa]NYE00302.1 LCP family protein required for cell wall assembly [Kineosphaera limosa]GAB96870.1 putative LytR family regulatory protein [Kineosphaera limosa NBRC 100340]
MSHLPHDRYQRPTNIPRADSGVGRAPARAGGQPSSAGGAGKPGSGGGGTGGGPQIPRGATVTIRPAEPDSGFGRFLGLTALGTVLPGSGLLLAGFRKTGGTLLAIFVALVLGAAAYLWVKGPQTAVVSLAVDGDFLLWLTIAAVAGAIVLVASIIWTGIVTWPRPASGLLHSLSSLCVLALCAIVVAPTVVGVRDIVVHRDLMQALFNQPIFTRTGVLPDVGQADPWAGHPRVNVMLIGSDSSPDRPGVRTDSMMLASIDTQTGNTLLFGLPRNLERVPFPAYSPLHNIWPEGFRCEKDCLLNDVWMQGEQHKDLYPGDPMPGITALNEAVTGVTGLTPDYDVVVNMAGFSSLVDAMGGVDITVRDRVPIGGKVEHGQIVPGSIRGWIEPGAQHLDGYHAMWFSRGRATTDDFDRMRRQRCMVGALVKQVNPAMMLERYPAIAKVAKDNIYTNIPQDQLPAWAVLATRMQQGTIRSLPFSNQVIRVGNPDFELMHEMVQAAVDGRPMPGDEPTATPGATGTATPTRTPTPTATPTPGATTPGATTTTPPDTLTDIAAAC